MTTSGGVLISRQQLIAWRSMAESIRAETIEMSLPSLEREVLVLEKSIDRQVQLALKVRLVPKKKKRRRAFVGSL